MKRSLLPVVAFVSFGAATLANAQTSFYDNTVNFTGQAFRSTGATTAARRTFFDADDIQVGNGFEGGKVNAFSFSTFNSGGTLGTTTVTANIRVRFFAADPTTFEPSTIIGGFDFLATAIAPGVTVRSVTIAPGSEFTVPTNGLFFAGLEYDSTTATAAQLNFLGQGFFNPPTIGSSEDLFFSTDATGIPGANPAGDFYNFDPGTGAAFPVSNFGWKFSGVAPVPEPATMAILGIGAAALLRRRRKSA